MIRKNIAIILIFVFFSQFLSLKASETNIEILQKLNIKSVGSIITQLKQNNYLINKLEINEHSSKSYFEQKLFNSLDSAKLFSLKVQTY